jgi:deoxyinosine 3'endonuclease (endonuclease V)
VRKEILNGFDVSFRRGDAEGSATVIVDYVDLSGRERAKNQPAVPGGICDQ